MARPFVPFAAQQDFRRIDSSELLGAIAELLVPSIESGNIEAAMTIADYYAAASEYSVRTIYKAARDLIAEKKARK